MPVKINGEVYYRTLEVCRKANISRSTLLRWLENGLLTKTRRDRRGWRLFTENDLRAIVAEVERINVEEIPRPK
jgi:DNA-binding transcriptional MerR regulator